MLLKLYYNGKTKGEVFLLRARFFENLARLVQRGFYIIMDSSGLWCALEAVYQGETGARFSENLALFLTEFSDFRNIGQKIDGLYGV